MEMPRLARLVAPGIAHHVTQRGTARQIVFKKRADRRTYLDLLRTQAPLAHVSILAYCLMDNHIHLVAVPEEEDSLAVLLRRVHGRYAQYYNTKWSRTGHLWQNRYFSCALDAAHLWTALRYVETNPVRAQLAASAEEYEWSSALGHLTGHDRARLLDMRFWRETGGSENWRALLAVTDKAEDVEALVRGTHSGQPVGEKGFTNQLRELRRERAEAVRLRSARPHWLDRVAAAG